MPELETISPSLQDKKEKFSDIFKAQETREVLAFLTAQFLSFLVYMSIRQLFPLYLQERFGLSEEQVVIKWAIITTVYTFTGLFARVPSGWIIEKYGRKIILFIAFVIMTLSVGGLAFTNNTALLAVLFSLLRLTNNVFGLASRSLLSDLKTRYKGLFNSVISSSGRLGVLIGTVGLGYVLDFLPAYAMIICVFALSILGLISFRLLFVKGKAETIHFLRRIDVKEGRKTKFDFQIFKSGSVSFFITAFIIFGIISGVTDPIIALYGKNVLNQSDSFIGTLLGLSQLSFIVVSPIIGWLISKKPNIINYLLLTSSLIMVGNYLTLYLFPDSVLVYGMMLFIKNIGHALFFPVVFTILTYELPKAHFSILYSIITTGFFLGVSVTSYLSGYLYNISYKLPWLAAVIASIVLCSTILVFVIYKIFDKRKSTEQ